MEFNKNKQKTKVYIHQNDTHTLQYYINYEYYFSAQFPRFEHNE